jgi:hypothetical protein
MSATVVPAIAYTDNDLHVGTAITLFDIITPTAHIAIQYRRTTAAWSRPAPSAASPRAPTPASTSSATSAATAG